MWWDRYVCTAVSKFQVMGRVQLDDDVLFKQTQNVKTKKISTNAKQPRSGAGWCTKALEGNLTCHLFLKIRFYWKATSLVQLLLSLNIFVLKQQNGVDVQSLRY